MNYYIHPAERCIQYLSCISCTRPACIAWLTSAQSARTNTSWQGELATNRKAKLERLWADIRLLIIDEHSKVGHRMIGMRNRRLKQFKGSDLPNGEEHVVLVVDNGR